MLPASRADKAKARGVFKQHKNVHVLAVDAVVVSQLYCISGEVHMYSQLALLASCLVRVFSARALVASASRRPPGECSRSSSASTQSTDVLAAPSSCCARLDRA